MYERVLRRQPATTVQNNTAWQIPSFIKANGTQDGGGIYLKKGEDSYEKFTPDNTFITQLLTAIKSNGLDETKGLDILNSISNNAAQFKYNDVQELENDVLFRLRLVASVKDEIQSIGDGPLPEPGNPATPDRNLGFGFDIYPNRVWRKTAMAFEYDKTSGLTPSQAIDMLFDRTSANYLDLAVDCSTAMVLNYLVALKKQIGTTAFNNRYKDAPLIIRPITKLTENERNSLFKTVDIKAQIEASKPSEVIAEGLEQLVPGDVVNFLNYATMRNDAWQSEWALFVGKIGGKYMFRGHPFDHDIEYSDMIKALKKQYDRFLDDHPLVKDERKMKAMKGYNNPDVVGGTTPGLYIKVLRPNVDGLMPK